MNSESKVLIVEDEGMIALALERQLLACGFTVPEPAASAEEAFQKIEAEVPQVVLMDIGIIGEMDGIEAARVVRTRYGIPVVFLTSRSDDTTLERAKSTEPFGYLTKPFGAHSVKAAIGVALKKHEAERQVENQRRLLNALLESSADGVCITNGSGEVLFLNAAAEKLTGWNRSEATGRSFREVIPIEDSAGRNVSIDLLGKTLANGMEARIPAGSILSRRNTGTVGIGGHLASACVGEQMAGVIATLRDTGPEQQEERRLSQERQMFAAGELAAGAAREFYWLFDIVQEALARHADDQSFPAMDFIQQTAETGKRMANDLMSWRDAYGAANPLAVKREIEEMTLLLERISGSEAALAMEIGVAAEVEILSTGSHFEQLLVHLVLAGKERIGGRGRIELSVTNHAEQTGRCQTKNYVRIAARSMAEKGMNGVEAAEQEPFLGSELPELGLTLVRAMVNSAGGFLRLSEPSESMSAIDVFWPVYEGRREPATTKESITLAIGLDLRMKEALSRAGGADSLVLEASTLAEAELIAAVFPGEIQAIVLNEEMGAFRSVDRAVEQIRGRWPTARFLTMGGAVSSSGADLSNPADLERCVRELLGQVQQPAKLAARASA